MWVYFLITLLGVDFKNIRINSDDTREVQNEEQICINPLNSKNLVAIWRDFRLGYRRVGVGYSLDGGLSWRDDLIEGTPYTKDSDPGLTYDSEGNFYAVILSFESITEPNGIFLYKSQDGGKTWVGPFTVVDGVKGVFEDKELIACDRTDSPYKGNLYVSWTRYSGEGVSDIFFTRSTDGGETFEEPIRVNDYPDVQWSVPCVGKDGTVYVAWLKWAYGAPFMMLDKSTDGGLLFGKDIIITPIHFGYGELKGGIGVFSYPALDADISDSPYSGNLYIAYADYGKNGDLDIYFIKSTDKGESWTAPKRINDDPVDSKADQFHPWLCVDEKGVITVVFYDRRNDPDNLKMDVYLTQSFDGGETFTKNVRVTDVSSGPTPLHTMAGLMGEYIGVAVRDGIVHPVWTDWREGDQNVYTGVPSIGIEEKRVKPLQRINLSPNPFKEFTVISFQLPAKMDVSLKVYDATGKLVRVLLRTQSLRPGVYNVKWEGKDLPSGIYFYELELSGERIKGKAVKL